MDERAAPNINILSFKSHDESSLNSFLNWSLKYGRIIVIATELIVIAAFLSRFWFDYQLTNLHDAIDYKTARVEQMRPTETNFLNLQSTVDTIGKLLDQRKNYANLLLNLNNAKPADMTFKEVVVLQDNLTFTATVGTPASLNIFLNTVTRGDRFSDVSLDDLSVKDGQLTISGTAKIKPGAYQ